MDVNAEQQEELTKRTILGLKKFGKRPQTPADIFSHMPNAILKLLKSRLSHLKVKFFSSFCASTNIYARLWKSSSLIAKNCCLSWRFSHINRSLIWMCLLLLTLSLTGIHSHSLVVAFFEGKQTSSLLVFLATFLLVEHKLLLLLTFTQLLIRKRNEGRREREKESQ